MASTIKQAFDEFLSNLEITSPQATKLSERQTNVRTAVEADLTVKRSFLAGSYKRHTLIAPLSLADVDIFIVLDDSYFETYKSNQAGLLDKVKTALKKKYTEVTDISRNGQAVTIAFSDFRVDVVPAFDRLGGGIIIPDSVGKRWIATDPLKHIELWSDANKSHEGYLIPFIKMVKAWNRTHSDLMNSFHLESLILQVLDTYEIDDYAQTALDFFTDAKTAIQYSVPDPAGFGGDTGSYLNQNSRDKVASRMETARARAESAIDLAESNSIQEAIEKWRLVFGDKFPAPEAQVAKASSFAATPLYQQTTSISRRANTFDPAPREEWIEDRVEQIVNGGYSVRIDATVSKPGFMVRALNSFLSKFSSRLLKRADLEFRVSTDVPEPYEVLWKVRNTGAEAQSSNQLRGEITSTGRYRSKKESTLYFGDHYIECYIVKNNRCVAWHRLEVPIGSYE